MKFEKLNEIPDLVPEHLLITPDREDLRAPREPEHTEDTITPVEIAYHVNSLNPTRFKIELEAVESAKAMGVCTEQVLHDGWGSVVGRVIVKAMLDPERHAPISMLRAYESELPKTRQPSPTEEEFFANFAGNFGLVDKA